MYLRHFALREAPFSITPDTAFFYPHDGAQDAYNMLLLALRSGEGFLKIVGEVGCGKTVLCRRILNTLQDEFVTAYIPNPDMGADDLLMALAHELELQLTMPLSRQQVLSALQEELLRHAMEGRPVVLCIDEAQVTRIGTLESLRLLSNLETEKQKLIQIVLFGQPELDVLLSRPQIRQLLQRITFSEYLGAMAPHRVQAYLEHRLAVAAQSSSTDIKVFDASAARALAQYSGGVPRLLNVLAHKCLMLAYGENEHRVNERLVNMAAKDTPGVVAKPQQGSWWRRWRNLWPILGGDRQSRKANASTETGRTGNMQ